MDLSTKYLGLTLKHPLVPSASPMSSNLERIRRLEDAQAPAIVLFSLFEEEIQQTELHLAHFLDYGRESFFEASHYLPEMPEYATGADAYLTLIADAKEVTDIPIIASLNCSSLGQWIEYARLIEQAGADALELNIYDLPSDPDFSGQDVETRYLEIVREVHKQTNLPLAVKLHPFFSSLPHITNALYEAGAKGVVLFNRFYQPDIDIEAFEVVPRLVLSSADEFRLPLRWTAILSGRLPADIAITTGIHSHVELIKAMMAGARVGMIASEILKHGPQRIEEILFELRAWMERHEYESIKMMQGCMSFAHVDEPSHYIRTNYLKVLRSFSFDPTGKML